MSEKNQPPVAATPKPSAPPVIRRFQVAEEDGHTRLMKRQVPAWTISGGIHVILMGTFILFFAGTSDARNKLNDKIVNTTVDEPQETKENLTNTDLGFDAELKAATDSPNEAPENVDAPTVPDEAIGAVNQEQTQPTQTFLPPGAGATENMTGSSDPARVNGTMMKGVDGRGSPFMMPGMIGRTGATKDALIRDRGGNWESEAAVARGLKWLSLQQKSDGRWQFDGGSKDDIAATGMSLLPFLAAGETHKQGKFYKTHVANGVTWLVGKQNGSGTFIGSSGMYAHAIATIALCEAYGMTLDPSLKPKAQAAINFIVKAQAGNGSWGYSAGAAGDTSIVGWQIQALKSGKLAGLNVPDESFKKATQFLEDVSTDSGARYGYTTKGSSASLSAVGLLCRQYMGWGPKNPSLAKGVEYLMTMQPSQNNFEMYYLYYATQVVHFFDGPEWHEKWNPKIRDMLIRLQVKQAGPNQGSWDKDGGHIGSSCGRLGTTCLCLLTLEVYYRHLPLYKRDNDGIAELER